MKITREKYPLVDFETRKKSLTDPIFKDTLLTKVALSDYREDGKYFSEYRQFINDIASTSDLKAKLIATTVINYLARNSDNLMRKMWPFLNEMSDETGMLLWEDWSYFYRKFTNGKDIAILYFIVSGNTSEIGIFLKKQEEETVRGNTMKSKASKVAFMLSVLVLPFLEFAECETKIINATQEKRVKLNKEKYISDITSNIEIVDSTWFTTIIRTEGFGVHGHFRLQPTGIGRKQRKMIWIKDFQKHGYTKRSHLDIIKTTS